MRQRDCDSRIGTIDDNQPELPYGSPVSTPGFTDDGFTDDRTTAINPARTSGGPDTTERKPTPPAAHAGVDFGLLVLRVVLGGTMAAHGAQKVFGVFGGPGIDGFAMALQGFGFTSQLTLLSWVTGLTELVAGAMLVLGFLTPLAAAGLLGVTACTVVLKFGGGFFASNGGFEYELMLAVLSFAFLFTGAGRLSLDRGRRWYLYAPAFGLLGLILAVAGAIVVLTLFR